jgi:hypothetical protein
MSMHAWSSGDMAEKYGYVKYRLPNGKIINATEVDSRETVPENEKPKDGAYIGCFKGAVFIQRVNGRYVPERNY